jgi:hypothetical protein
LIWGHFLISGCFPGLAVAPLDFVSDSGDVVGITWRFVVAVFTAREIIAANRRVGSMRVNKMMLAAILAAAALFMYVSIFVKVGSG